MLRIIRKHDATRHVWRRKTVASAVLLAWLSACSPPPYQELRGTTMGTYYAIQYAPADGCGLDQTAVDGLLARVNNAMSTYIPDAEISRFNRLRDRQVFPVSDDFIRVLTAARYVFDVSGGAFDPTVGPLVELWGFGASAGEETPSATAQALAARHVGFDHVEILDAGLRKHHADAELDVSALAKGYAVDMLADALNCTDYMVDIGGEMRLGGQSERGQSWRIGIEVPDASQLGEMQTVLSLSDRAIATSGDYRNFRVVDGRRVDHVIDPRSGKPADNRVVSVTVIHDTAMLADAFATALMVLDAPAGIQLADQEGFAAYIIERTENEPTNSEGALSVRYNEAMASYFAAQPGPSQGS